MFMGWPSQEAQCKQQDNRIHPPHGMGGGGHGEGGLDEGRCAGLDEQMSRKAQEQKSRGAEKLVGVFQFEDRSFVAFVFQII